MAEIHRFEDERESAAAKQRKRQDAWFRALRAQVGDDVTYAVLVAVRDRSIAPFRKFPSPLRERLIAAFRQTMPRRKRQCQVMPFPQGPNQ